MKRLIALLLVVLMAVSLCGCAGEKSKVPEPGTALNIFYQAIMDAQPENAEELILFEESNPDLIASFYPGLDSIELSQQAYYMPPIATHPCEIVLVEVKNDADVQTVTDIFQARIDIGADNTNFSESAASSFFRIFLSMVFRTLRILRSDCPRIAAILTELYCRSADRNKRNL